MCCQKLPRNRGSQFAFQVMRAACGSKDKSFNVLSFYMKIHQPIVSIVFKRKDVKLNDFASSYELRPTLIAHLILSSVITEDAIS
jgi:hypothetical protein